MSLLDDLKDEANFLTKSPFTCGVCALLHSLPKNEAQALQTRLDDKAITHMALHKVLKKNDIIISDSVIGRHRRKVCSGGTQR